MNLMNLSPHTFFQVCTHLLQSSHQTSLSVSNMDFRSQLSAFQNKGSGGRGGNNNNNNRDRNDRSRSPNRRYDNSNINTSNYDRGGGVSGGRYPSSRGGYGGGGGGNDRQRPRPSEWGGNSHYGSGGGPPNSRRRLNNYNVDPDGLGDLRRNEYRIPRALPDPPTEEEEMKKPKHIVLMAITIEDMPFEHLWRGWCDTLHAVAKDQDDYYVSLVCHAKFPQRVKSEWLKQRLLTYPPKRGRGNSYEDPTFLTRTPAWGSVEITRAMLDLLQESLKIGHCTQEDKRFSANRFLVRAPPNKDEKDPKIPPGDHFLFISETCVPVVTAPEFFAQIANVSVSWVNARHRRQEGTPKNKYEDDQFAGINRRIPGQYRWKADQWVLLSRRHASLIIDMDRPHIPPKYQLWQSFRDINASDEMYFPTALALLGFLRYTSDGDDTQKSRAITPGPTSTSVDSAARPPAATPSPGGKRTPAPASDTVTPVPAAVNKNECVLLRPVTYTDWTEGMKNPAMFCHGAKDLKRVAKLARGNGCLVARKFSTYLPIPGVPKEEQKITGEITVGQWSQVMSELHREEADARTVLPFASESVQEVEESEKTGSVNGSTNDQGNEDSRGEKVKEALVSHSKGETSHDGSDNDDNDQEENQLE